VYRFKKEDAKWILTRLAVIAGMIILLVIVISIGMKKLNKSMGIEDNSNEKDEDTEPYTPPANFYVSDENVPVSRAEELIIGPEASWEMTPCSIYVSGLSQPILDSLPAAPETKDKPLEALFLVKRWASEAGIENDDVDKVYVFTRLDTIYVDLPVEKDFQSLKLTIENRFICFTTLFPLVSGNVLSSYPDGISLRGIKGVFRQ